MTKTIMRLAIATGAAALASSAPAADYARKPFGALADGAAIEAVTLTNARGVSATVISYGATLQSLVAPDRKGAKADVVLGYPDLTGYVDKPNYFGVTVGRYANRIAKGKFTLDGKQYTLATNNAPNALHGGIKGWDKVAWRIVEVKRGPTASVTLAYTSPDGEEGYPGTVEARVTYSLNERSELTIDHRATTDRPTIVNMTNHSIFNLAGESAAGGVLGHQLTILADRYTPVDATLIPSGPLKPVAGTPFDFRKPMTIGGRNKAKDKQLNLGRGYDHNYVLRGASGGTPRLAARLRDPASGRTLEILSDQPGIQLYSGNFLDGTVTGKGGKAYGFREGVALEPQHFPDAPNQPRFASTRLDPGKQYRNVMVFRLSAR